MRASWFGVAVVLVATGAHAQTGVSDDRVNLPDGPGSRDGIGDNASFDDNMGLLSYAIPFAVPRGYAAVTPQLGLNYSSGGGASLAGIGWNFPTASIERYTGKGLPDYDENDRMSVGPGMELVRVSASADLAFYRARFEGGFVRYAWHDVDDGTDGYWTSEDPDGTVSYYGANTDGVIAADSRLAGDEGTFRWLIKESVDVWGHRLVYRWSRHGGAVPLLDSVEYAFANNDDATGARARVSFRYDLRPDLISDARSGFEELIAHRLVGVDVFADDERVRGYELAYEDFDTAGGLSRLASVTRTGKDGSADPVHHAFRHSQGLGGTCSGDSCEDPQLVTMGSLGVNLGNGTATLIDMNGDGIPDVLEAAAGQAHRIHLSALDETGRHTWRTPITSALAGTSAHALTSPFVQPLDVDGDGFVDLLNAQSGDVLRNLGGGDWSRIEPISGDATSLLTELSSDLGKIRFLDADLDRRIDVLRADATGTTLYRNTGDGGFVVDFDVDDIGAGFEEDNLELADMNGDGLLDPVKLLVGEVQFRVNLGRGRFSEFRTIENAPITSADLAFTSLEDLNGDGIDDIVIVSADQVRYALNRNAASFEALATITDAGGNALPTRDATTTVLFADMNANGSDDVVWIDAAGNTTYLELFPVRPNLITHIENGVGMNIDVTYVSSALVRARNPLAWQHATPSSMLVVDTRDTYAVLDVAGVEQHDLRRFDYQNSFYDSVEKVFRGFEVTTAVSVGNASQQELTTRSIYDLGLTSPARAGKLLAQEWYGASDRLRRTSTQYSTCPVAGVPADLPVAVEWICTASTTAIIEEGAADADILTVGTRYQYDGFGNRTVTHEDGVTGTGAAGTGTCAACTRDDDVGGAPCGAQCIGDEFILETDYVAPTATATAVGGWLLRLEQESRTSTGLGRTTRARTYYDGPAFVGLPLGTATRGSITREETWLDDAGASTLQRSRYKRDVHGNVIEQLNARGDLDDEDGRQLAIFDATGLDLLAEERVIARDVDGTTELVRLRRENSYDDVFEDPTTTTAWFLADEPASKVATRYTFDAFGRLATIVRPGDTAASVERRYEYGDIFTRVITRSRSDNGADADIVDVECHDGRGRPIHSSSRIDDDHWLSSGVTVFNAHGRAISESETFTATDDACSAVVPADVGVTTTSYDALGREREVVDVDSSTTRRTYLPLTIVERDDASVAANGPPSSIARYDGLGRVTRISRGAGDDAGFVDVDYDDLGELRGSRDALGNTRVQARDLAARITSTTDPDRGLTRFVIDDDDNVVGETQANGRVTRREYDALGRKTAEWDDDDEAATKTTYLYDRHPACPSQSCDNAAARLVGHTYPLGEFGRGEDAWGYDERGRPTETTRTLLGTTFRMEARFDDADRLVEQTYPGGRVVSTTLDGLGRAIGIPGILDEVTFAGRGTLASMRLHNGVTTTFEHDAAFRLLGIKAAGAAGAVVDLALTRDGRGNVTEVVDAVGTGGVSSSSRLQYDSLSRLTEAALDPAGKNETVTWRYDAIERLVEKAASAASADNLGIIAYEGTSHRAVDAGGVITRDASGLASSAAGFDLVYDHRNQIVDVSKDGEEVARYFYTGSGFRVLRVVGSGLELTPFPGYAVRDGVSRLRINLDGSPIFEEESASFAASLLPDGNDDGAITAADAWLARQEELSRTMLRSAARRLLFADGDDDDTTARAFLHTDATSSTVAVTDANGAVKERLSYRPYGAVLATTAVQTEYASFAGHDVDTETGFINFGLRSLDPRLGAFLTPDPAGIIVNDEASIINVATAYNYARNNPLLLTDDGGATPSPFWAKAAVVFRVLGVAAVVGGAIVAGYAISAGTMGMSNVIGAVVGGVVGFGAELANQRSMASRLAGTQTPERHLALRVGLLAWATFKGVVAGGLSMGLSSVFDAANGGVSVVDNLTDGKHPQRVRAARIFVAAASAVTGGALYSADVKTFGDYGEYEVPGLANDSAGNTLEAAAAGAEATTTEGTTRWKNHVTAGGRNTAKFARAVVRIAAKLIPRGR